MSKDFWNGYFTAALICLAIQLLPLIAHCNVTDIIRREAVAQGFEPAIAIAIARVESALDPKAVGKAGELGLFQLHPKYIPAAKHQNLLDPKINARIGIQHLIFWKNNCPTKEGMEWIQCFNQGFRNPRYPTLLPYYKKFEKALVLE